MVQSTDIVLDGAGYMLLPGSSAYTRTQDGIAEGKTGRIQLKDFFGGQLRTYQLERDKIFEGLSVGPVNGGQGVEPWPYVESDNLDTSFDVPQYTDRYPFTMINEYTYFSINKKIVSTGAISSSTWGLSIVDTHGNPITGMCFYAGGLLVSRGGAGDIIISPATNYPTFGTGTYVTLLTGSRGDSLVSYAGAALWIDRSTGYIPSTVKLVTGTGVESRYLDNFITKLVTVDNQVLAVTRTGLYTFTGRVKDVMINNPAWTSGGTAPAQIPGKEWSGDFTPFFQQGSSTDTDDFRFVLGFGGRTYAWYGKRVMEFVPMGDRAGWRDTGLTGQQCDGACVAGGYLVVCIKTHRSRSQMWAWDGSGWWKILDRTDFESNRLHNPIPVQGAGDFDLIVFQHGTKQYLKVRLNRREYPTNTIPNSSAPQSGEAFVKSPLIDCNERDKNKAWRKVGAVFAHPQPQGNSSSDSVTVELLYSVDNGSTWVSADTITLASNTHARNNFTLDADIASAAAVSRWLQLQVKWSSLSAWAPVLCGLWAEFEVLDAPARRRKWQLMVQADDELIDRGSAQMSLSGRQIIQGLWDSWENGATVTFRDIDYDADSTERNVRIVGISESTDRPSDAGAWGHSKLKLILVEV